MLKAFVSDVLRTAVPLTAWGLVISEHIGDITICVGPSMLPTFSAQGDVVLTEKLSVRYDKLSKGDVVVAVSPKDCSQLICKRIIGMPGDRVCVNPEASRRRFRTVPWNHVWLQGDNLRNSTDSRAYGPVSMSLLRSRVVYKLWPAFDMGPIHAVVTDTALPREPIEIERDASKITEAVVESHATEHRDNDSTSTDVNAQTLDTDHQQALAPPLPEHGIET
eukprot:TRINITY_DN11114_c0_g1_i3.p2 TRINITY_DN11114_c0_g1~~TRINITY_DN11114_c0_g1_i3.p2  ORF type:complete len:221 (+),score=18.18 TRINITY_DN11114_c0_g1_i3:1717-2379(+)